MRHAQFGAGLSRVAPGARRPNNSVIRWTRPGDHRGLERWCGLVTMLAMSLGFCRVGNRGLQHADDRGAARAERTQAYDPSDHRGVAVKRLPPEPVGEHDYARGIRSVVLRIDQAAEHGVQAHHLEASCR